ncbi:MAG TPA: response regulator transcription factor [Bacteroidetes bacterium]|nr:response regulator transcription factor [Bacteroidota bacterium]
MNKIQLILADDHELIRSGTRQLITQESDLEIIGEANNGIETLKLLQNLEPDVLLLDIEMPELNGLKTAEKALESYPNLAILLLTMYTDAHYLRKSLEIGCRGYLLKQSDTNEIIEAIRTVAAGEVYFGGGVSRNFLRMSVNRSSLNPFISESKLSKREIEVLCLIADGQSSKEIADKLFISVRTVDTHRSNILHKLNLSNTAQLVRYAIKYKLVDLD